MQDPSHLLHLRPSDQAVDRSIRNRGSLGTWCELDQFGSEVAICFVLCCVTAMAACGDSVVALFQQEMGQSAYSVWKSVRTSSLPKHSVVFEIRNP